MRIDVQVGGIVETASELIVLNLLQGVSRPSGATGAVDAALDGAISERVEAGDFVGKAEQTALLYTRGAIPAKRVLVVGLGPADELDLEVIRRSSAIAARSARKLGVTDYHTVVHGGGSSGLGVEGAAQAVVEGTILGSYAFDEHRTELEDREAALVSMTVVEYSADAISAVRAGASIGQIVGESACWARDLVNQPANYLTPMLLAEAAHEMANEVGLACRVLEESDMSGLGMGALLGVAQGSQEPAKFITLEHNAGRTDLDTYVVVGKGITFDSGGISIKPTEGMGRMKSDMSGAATALGVLRAAAALDLPLRVIGLAPATENLPGGRAYKPGDVLESMSSLTIEVISTDAEGRLILADALHYAKRYNPMGVVDLATLTGACVTALGHVACGLMGTEPDLLRKLEDASAATGERVWELPLHKEYAEQIESDVADVKNSGGRPAGAITGGMFLKRFATGYPWAHLDIAGTAWTDKTDGYLVKGGTGFGVRLLVQWLRQACSPDRGACRAP